MNYIDEPVVEIQFHLKDKEIMYLFGTPIHTETGVECDTVYLYSYEEYQRLGKPNDLPIAFYLPHSDISARLDGGFLYMYKNNKLIYVINRQNIDKIISGINDCLVDFMTVE